MGSGNQSRTIGWQDLKRLNSPYTPTAARAIMICKTGDAAGDHSTVTKRQQDATPPAIREDLSHLLGVFRSLSISNQKSILRAPFGFQKRETTTKQWNTMRVISLYNDFVEKFECHGFATGQEEKASPKNVEVPPCFVPIDNNFSLKRDRKLPRPDPLRLFARMHAETRKIIFH